MLAKPTRQGSFTSLIPRTSAYRTKVPRPALHQNAPPKSFAVFSPISVRRLFHSTPTARYLPINNVSHVRGPTEPPLHTQTLGQHFDSKIAAFPDSPALVVRHEPPDHHSLTSKGGHVLGEGDEHQECLRWNYAEMGKHVDALARGLLKMGLKKGDGVGCFLGNCSSYALMQWATAKAGLIMVCVNPAAPGPELLAALNLSECKAFVISPTIRKNDHFQLLNTLFPTLASTAPNEELQEPTCPTLKYVIMSDNTSLGAQGFEQLLSKNGLAGRDLRHVFEWEGKGVPGEDAINVHDVINQQFTSGTTGFPKAVALTHHNLLNNGQFIGDSMHFKLPSAEFQGERLLNAPPMFHCFGLVLGNLATYTHGGCIVMPSEFFDPALTLRAAHLEKCTALHGVPTMFIAELALLDRIERGETVKNLSDLGKLDFSALRTGIAAGSPVPDEVMRRLISKMNLKDLTITYGMTETSPATTNSTPNDPIDLRCATIGRVLPHTHIRIVDPDHENYPDPSTPTVPLNTRGELWSGGYALMDSYYRNPKETNKVMFKDDEGVRWIKTGDQAEMDSNGYIKITGRLKDLIIRGGENISAVVVEAKALLLAGVEDCSVVAVRDDVMGEVVGCFIQRADSTAGRSLTGENVRAHLQKVLGHQAAPDWVWWLGEDGVGTEYPKTASGKIRKVELREWTKPLVEQKIGRVRKP